MELNGSVCNFRDPKEAFRAGVGVVHQEQALFTNLTVAENIDQHRSDGGLLRRFGIQHWSRVNRQATAALRQVGWEHRRSGSAARLYAYHRPLGKPQANAFDDAAFPSTGPAQGSDNHGGDDDPPF